MKSEITIKVEVIISERWPNVNEILGALKQVLEQLGVKMAQVVLEQYQQEVIKRLTSRCGPEAKKGLGRHQNKGDPSRKCRCRSFVRQGGRRRRRKIKTDIGEVSFAVAYVQCKQCGKKVAPMLDVLGLKRHQRQSTGLMRIISEAISETSYARAAKQAEALSGVPVAKSSAHRWACKMEVPRPQSKGVKVLMADGTGFKKWPGERGVLRVAIGLDDKMRLQPLGVWAGRSWGEISKGLEKKLKRQPEQLELFVSDGERGLDRHLSRLANRAQRCRWHLARDLSWAMWQDGSVLAERKAKCRRLREIVGIEISAEQYRFFGDKDKEEIRRKLRGAEKEYEKLVEEFRLKGYCRAASYLENAGENVFSQVKLWIETGLIAPRTTSVLESMFREIGRRVKKLGWNWSDRGVERIARIVVLRHYDAEQWEKFWQERLGLEGRCQMRLVSCSIREVA